MKAPADTRDAAEKQLHDIKHNIKNQLSNINLALDQLRFEMPEATADSVFYMDTIATSCTKINTLLGMLD